MSDIVVPLNFPAQQLADASGNAVLLEILPLTPVQLAAWMSANVTTFAQVQAVLCALVLAVQTDTDAIQ